jgi:DNA-directed RNA polymerase specialized sigma24 family protein
VIDKCASAKQASAATKQAPANSVSANDPAIAADRQLIDRCLARDVIAWSVLYRQHHDPLLTNIRGYLGPVGCDRNLVEEIAARVWYAIVKDDFALLAKFDVRRGCRLSTFLSVLAKSETRNLFRSEKRRKSREHLASRPEVDGGSMSPAALLSDEEFLATLSPAERTFYLDVLVAPLERRAFAQQGYSSENIWQLNYRVRKKLERFISS